MASPLIRIAGPLLVGALAGAGAIAAGLLVRERQQLELTAPRKPLAVEGWWSSDSSSSLAHAHPAVLIIDAEHAHLVDSWDRRLGNRVAHPLVRRTPEWPARGLIVVDAATGDLLTVLSSSDDPGAPELRAPDSQGMVST